MVIIKRKEKYNKIDKSIVTYLYPESKISEQFRTIQTNIKFSLAEQESHVFLITSPGDGEGKSITTVNLAVSMAQQKAKVLIIDANIRKPSLHLFFKASNSTGLTDILTGKVSFYDAIQHTGIGRLDLIGSGIIKYNPVELLGSSMFQEVLKTALKSYDVILIDSNSLLEVTDTKLLVNQCDGVILVIQNGKTKFEKAAEAKKVLEFAKANLIGVVMNK
ncbi:CpsD/CapB family tyrosine-protein kinase [Neobacillus drentensis]